MTHVAIRSESNFIGYDNPTLAADIIKHARFSKLAALMENRGEEIGQRIVLQQRSIFDGHDLQHAVGHLDQKVIVGLGGDTHRRQHANISLVDMAESLDSLRIPGVGSNSGSCYCWQRRK